MKNLLLLLLLILHTSPSPAQAINNFEHRYSRPLSDVLRQIERLFDVKLKFDKADTTGLVLTYADSRLRPYSAEESLRNVLAPFDMTPYKERGKWWRIRRYDYPRRTPEDGRKLTAWLTSLYSNREQWEARRDTLKREMRERLEIDRYLALCPPAKPTFDKQQHHDGYDTQDFRLPTTPGHTVCGTIFTPNAKSVRKAAANKKGQLPLIMCPAGHFPDARFNPDLMERYTTLARMGFICVSYDLWGWGESEKEVGRAAHETAEAHVMQSLNGVKILDFMMERKDVDPERIGCNGGSGGGSQVVVLINIDPRYTAACPTVSMSSWFDGGCPCESGKAIHQSGGGTCNMELAAMFAPKPMMVVSDGGDWTSTTPELEYPFLQRIYSFYNAKGQVHNTHLPNERHDFGPNKRQAVYDFFRKLWLEQKD